MLGIKLEGTSIENSMKQQAKRGGDFFGQPKKYTRQVKLETKLPRGQVSRKISVEHCRRFGQNPCILKADFHVSNSYRLG